MNHRFISIVLLVISLLAIPFGYLLLHPDIVGLCPKNLDANCLPAQISFGMGKPLYWSTQLLPVLFLALIFVRKEVFDLWWKVILPLSVVAFLLIAISPPLPDFLVTDRTVMTALMVKLIIVVSVIVIAWKYWRLSRSAKKSKAA